MSLRYLLDTNIISEPIRPTPNANVLDRLSSFPKLLTTKSAENSFEPEDYVV